MPLVKMPTGETVDMPDNPSDDQLSALDEINKSGSTPDYNTQWQSKTPWGPEGSLARKAQLFLSDKPFENPVVNNLARSTGLLGRAAYNGFTGTANLVGDAAAQAANLVGGAVGHNPNIAPPSQGQQQWLTQHGMPVPHGVGENVATGLGSLAFGAYDPMMTGITAKIAGPQPLYNAPPAPTPASAKADTINEARAAGLKIPPSMAQGSRTARLAEDMAGKPQVQKMANASNIDTLNAIATKEAGLPPGTPLTHDTLNTAIKATYDQGYAPVAQLGTITTGSKYRNALNAAMDDYNKIEKSFPGTAPQEIPDIINKYRVKSFDSQSVVPTLQDLRENATNAYNAGNPAVGRTYVNVANAIEDAIDLNVAKRQPDLIKDFRAARTAIAKQAAVRDMVVEGSGNVNPATLAARYGKHPERYTEGLATIGKFAKTFPQLARPNAVPPSMFTNPELAMMGGSPLTAMMGGGPSGLAMASVPLARMATRQALLSPFMQSHMSLAQQGPSWLARAIQSPAAINAAPTALELMQNGLYGGDNGQ